MHSTPACSPRVRCCGVFGRNLTRGRPAHVTSVSAEEQRGEHQTESCHRHCRNYSQREPGRNSLDSTTIDPIAEQRKRKIRYRDDSDQHHGCADGARRVVVRPGKPKLAEEPNIEDNDLDDG
jgi:hypothetical protein